MTTRRHAREPAAGQPSLFGDVGPTFKQCCRCKEWLSLSEFHKNARQKGGLEYRCKKCRTAYRKEHPQSEEAKRRHHEQNLERSRNLPPEHPEKANSRKRMAAWYRENRERAKAANTSRARRRKYGVTEDMFQSMLAEQAGRCAICNTEFSGAPHVDHCHQTGAVRGLLCRPCNLGIGSLRDDTDRLRAAIAYLERSRK